MTKYPPGLYFLNIKSGGRLYTKKSGKDRVIRF